MPPLKFTRFEVWQVAIPGRRDLGISVAPGRAFDTVPVHIVLAKTNQGFVALGESARADDAATVNRTLKGLLGREIGRSTPATLWMKPSYERGYLGGMRRTRPLWSWDECEGQSMFLAESLWLDAVGKSAGVPAHVLMGGAVRNEVKVDFWAAQPDARALYRLVVEAVERGCRGMKLKSSAEGNTVHALAEIRDDLPDDFSFTVDPMFNWRSLHESRRLFEILAQLDLEVRVEDPFPYDAIEDWQTARSQYRTTLVWHTRDERDLRTALREETADAFNIACRCAFEAVKLSQVLAFHAKDCWFGSQLETGIYQQVRLHSASVAPTCVLPSDLQSQWVREHSLVRPGMAARDGLVSLGDEPGLGVEIDRNAVKRYAVKRWTVA